MRYEINFINHFSDSEQEKIKEFVAANYEYLELHLGSNFAIDVSDAIGRTANVDIEVFAI